jgi:hypothetical protein
MQLGEKIAVEVMQELGDECPFDHTDPDKPPTVNNQLVGNGQTLGKNMAPAQTTITYEKNRTDVPGDSPYPEKLETNSFPILIHGFKYPLTAAAHHLIPAQESLKKADTLLEVMVGGNLYPTDIGYEVNGAENGVWLPGNYAVGGSGTGEWTSAPSVLPDNEGIPPRLPPAPTPAAGSSSLTGNRHEFLDPNRKGKYVRQATKFVGGQFHDRHVEYSKLVLSTLDKLAELYKKKQMKSLDSCPKCKKIREKRSKLGTPFRLAHTLNSVSKKYRGYLVGSRGHKEVFTSRWGLAAELEGISALES